MASPTPPPGHPDPDSIAERLKQQFGEEIDPTLPLDPEPAPDKDAPSSLFDRLRGAGARGTRYRLLGEVARGGMGVILKIWDDELRRTLAMKVVLGRGDESKGDTPHVDPKTLGRFLEEAQVTGQLDHPGIVPVHELGLGADGRVYFTMRLVKGEDLRSIFEKVRTGDDGWNQVRALGVLLKVCEAMSYAHSKKVVHRDLKPANVMVGKFGEVYVMDWGLARVLGREDKHDLRIQPQPTTPSVVKTERREMREVTPDSPLVTMDGDVVGTPSYMPPEQAKGQLENLGPHSDVYSLGAMLYQLLTDQMPYVPTGARVSQHTILNAVLQGPPPPVESLAPKTPPELVAICEKAMAREVSARYLDTQEFASDLRAYLEGRVVRAYEAGTWAETRKWVRRNKPLAASLATAFVAVVVGAGAFAAKAKETKLYAERADILKNEAVAQARELRIRGLIQDLASFDRDDDEFGTPFPKDPRGTEWWLKQAHKLVDGVDGDSARGNRWSPGLRDVEEALTRVRKRAMSADEAAPLQMLPRAFVRAGNKADPDLLTWRFNEGDDEWWHAELVELRNALMALRDKLTTAERSVHSSEASAAWTSAIEAIASSEKYRGVRWPNGERLTSQLGLVPIGPDSVSGLWEFSHLDSGEVASRAADGTIVLKSEMGLVFVLLPGGRIPVEVVAEGQRTMQDENLPRIDLAPFFVSKYELTNEQWDRLGGWRRSGEKREDPMLPVTSIHWQDSVATLSGSVAWLSLPTEAQWEFACRAGTATLWWTGNEESSLRGAAKIEFDRKDNSQSLAKVGSLRANPFGLHDMHGNVLEWCRDAWAESSLKRRPGDGLHDEPQARGRVLRGGFYWDDAEFARSSNRILNSEEYVPDGIGIRPARGITP